MKERRFDVDYLRAVDSLSEDYVQKMPDREYQMVGRLLDFSPVERHLGVVRVDFDTDSVVAEDVVSNVGDMDRELVTNKFCDEVTDSGIYSCYSKTTQPLGNLESDRSVQEILDGWRLYFETQEIRDSTASAYFFDEFFDIDSLEDTDARILE